MSYCPWSRFAPTLRDFGAHQSIDQSVINKLTLSADGPITCVYAPFDHVTRTARLAIVGITPGRVQTENALRAAGAALRAGKPESEALRLAKLTASFSG